MKESIMATITKQMSIGEVLDIDRTTAPVIIRHVLHGLPLLDDGDPGDGLRRPRHRRRRAGHPPERKPGAEGSDMAI